MMPRGANVRPFSGSTDYERMIDYFHAAEPAFLRGMGVDPALLPARAAWLERLLPDLARDDRDRQTFYLGWFDGDTPVGHSNVNRIRFGQDAYFHLHLWDPARRRAGLGTELVRQSVNVYLRRFGLAALYCEPYAENPAPNRLLRRLGFRFVARHRTVPGLINFDQEVNRWVIEREL